MPKIDSKEFHFPLLFIPAYFQLFTLKSSIIFDSNMNFFKMIGLRKFKMGDYYFQSFIFSISKASIYWPDIILIDCSKILMIFDVISILIKSFIIAHLLGFHDLQEKLSIIHKLSIYR